MIKNIYGSQFKKYYFITLLCLLSLLRSYPTFAAHKVINLEIAYKTVYFANRPAKAIAVNNQIPAPTLHFKEGDQVTINVYNHLDKGT
ncbi:TPA: multicopper oxidase domain-containing protein, partial [Legionella anisa]